MYELCVLVLSLLQTSDKLKSYENIRYNNILYNASRKLGNILFSKEG